MPVTHAKVWITSGEASRQLGVSRGTLRRLSDEGLIGTMSLPMVRAKRYRVADIERLIAERSTQVKVEGNELVAAVN
jgi:predicted site-specific integrase-resolvase